LVASSNLVAATIPLKSSVTEQGISISKAIKGFLLTRKVEGKSYSNIEGYPDSI